MMIGIRLGDVDLDMPVGAGVSVEWVSTLFNDSSELLGSYTYPFTLPFTKRNDAALGFARLPENRLARKDYAVTLSIMGMPWKRTVMQFDVAAAGYSANLLIDNAEFADFIKNRDLTDLFAIYTDGVFRDLTWIKVSESADETRVVVTNSMKNPGKYPWVFFPVRNELVSGTMDIESGNNQPKHYINRYFPVEKSLYKPTTDDTDKGRRWHTPFFYLSWVLEQLFSRLGFKPMGEFFSSSEMLSLVIYNTGLLDYETFYAAEGLKLAPARHLPKIKLNDFIKALRNAPLNLSFYFDGNTREAWVGMKESLLTTSYRKDLSAWTDARLPVMKRNEAGAFVLKAKFDEADEVDKILPSASSYRIGDDDQEAKNIEMGIGSVNMLKIANPDNTAYQIRTPWARQVGNMYSARAKDWQAFNDPDKLYAFSSNSFAFRLLSYKGVIKDQPYATSDSLDPEGLNVYAMAAQPGGDKGWLATWCREWFLFLALSERHELQASIPADVLLNLSPLQKMAFKTDSGVLIPALFDRLSFEAGVSGSMVQAKLSVYPHFNLTALLEKKVFEEVGTPEVIIYARLSIENKRTEYPDSYGYTVMGDVLVRFYKDATGLIALDVKDLIVFYEEVSSTTNLNGSSATIADKELTGASGSVFYIARNTETQRVSMYEDQDSREHKWTLKTNKKTKYILM